MHRYQFERTNPSEALPVLEVSHSICNEAEGDFTEQLALSLGSRTWVVALTKDFEASYHYAQDRLELEKQLYEKRCKVTANLAAAYNDLGATYSMKRLPTQAFPLLLKSKELRESMPAFKPEHNFSPLHELSLAYWHHDENEEAIKCLLQTLTDREAALGLNDRQSVRTGQIFYALGNVRVSQAFVDEGAMWHQKALVHFRATGVDNHYKTASACYRVAEHHMRNKQFTLARYVSARISDYSTLCMH
jgi:tetratricopeptide (TPR) repeat protein